MTRERRVASALVAFAVVVLGCSPPSPRRPKHVVLISLDTTRADHLGCYGMELDTTPSIDRFARDAVVFEDVTTPAPSTLAAHTSLMTGKSPRAHGVARNGFVIHPANAMLAELLKAKGFSTASFIGSIALEHRFGFDRGFDHVDETFTMDKDVDHNQRRAEEVTDATLAYLDRAHAERWFLFVHYFDAHTPYDAPEPWNRKFGRADGPGRVLIPEVEIAAAAQQKRVLGRPLGVRAVVANGLPRELVAGAPGTPLGSDEDYAAQYANEIAYLDHHVGRLLDGLAQRGILDEALVIITGDHGETFWEHADFWDHGLAVYQTTTSVPLIVRAPGAAARRVEQPVSTLDVLPTVLELVDVPSPAGVEGKSLRTMLEGSVFDRGPIFSEATKPTGPMENETPWRNEHKSKCVRSGRFKYVVTPYSGLEELYDVAIDPGERRNLLIQPTAEVRAKADELRAELDAWRTSLRPLESHRNVPGALDLRKRLGQMGYVEGDDE